jgi:hypothetical protein
MRLLNRVLAMATLLTVASSPLAAQGITGRWITEFERTIRNENGAVSAGEKTKARLVLAQRGDSVTGTLESLEVPEGGRARPPRQLRGKISGNKASLSAEFEARRNINGEESATKVTVVYDFTINGDRLEGTMTTKSAEMDMPPRPFTAVREKP